MEESTTRAGKRFKGYHDHFKKRNSPISTISFALPLSNFETMKVEESLPVPWTGANCASLIVEENDEITVDESLLGSIDELQEADIYLLNQEINPPYSSGQIPKNPFPHSCSMKEQDVKYERIRQALLRGQVRPVLPHQFKPNPQTPVPSYNTQYKLTPELMKRIEENRRKAFEKLRMRTVNREANQPRR